MRVSYLMAMALCSCLCFGQEVTVSQGNGNVALTVQAQRSYKLMSGEVKMPILSVTCTHKGKKTGHLLTFSPGGILVDDSPEASSKGGPRTFHMTIGSVRQMTMWAPYGDVVTYAYFGKVETERLKFIQSLLTAGSISIEFVPFLTGVPITSDFDLSQLRVEMDKHPECVTN